MTPYICSDCPRQCAAPRGETGAGFCRMGADPVIARAAPHYDEEPVISGTRGSGAVFFSGCALRCRYCQNYPISHQGFGRRISVGTPSIRRFSTQISGLGRKVMFISLPAQHFAGNRSSISVPLSRFPY